MPFAAERAGAIRLTVAHGEQHPALEILGRQPQHQERYLDLLLGVQLADEVAQQGEVVHRPQRARRSLRRSGSPRMQETLAHLGPESRQDRSHVRETGPADIRCRQVGGRAGQTRLGLHISVPDAPQEDTLGRRGDRTEGAHQIQATPPPLASGIGQEKIADQEECGAFLPESPRPLQDLPRGPARIDGESPALELLLDRTTQHRLLDQEQGALARYAFVIELEEELPLLGQDHRAQAGLQLGSHDAIDGLLPDATELDQGAGDALTGPRRSYARLGERLGPDARLALQEVLERRAARAEHGVTDHPVLEADPSLAVPHLEAQRAGTLAGADDLQDVRERQVFQAADDAHDPSDRRTTAVGSPAPVTCWPPRP